MEKIPSAEDFFDKYANLYQFEEGDTEYLIDKEDFIKVMQEFAKLHTTAALKRSHTNNQLPLEDLEFSLDCYPLENIK